MKKNTKTSLSNNLAKYGALSLAIAGVADATGQVIFTDVDPDFVGIAGNPAAEFLGDFNDDGTNDLRIIAGLVGGAGEAFTAINNDAGSVSGLTVGQMVGNYTYALNLEEGTLISAGTGDFGNVGSLCYLDGIADTFCGAGNSTPNGFAGIEFTVGGNTHYGWIELTGVTGSTFTVTGFAFNATPDEPIAAGDTGLSVNDQAFENFNYTVANGMLTMSAKTALENVTIFNISGQQVINKGLSSTNENVEISNLSTGVYIATVTVEGRAKSFKFVK